MNFNFEEYRHVSNVSIFLPNRRMEFKLQFTTTMVHFETGKAILHARNAISNQET